MGARLVAMAMTPTWASKLSSTEQLVLVAMCLTALDGKMDDQERGRYFGGVDHLVNVVVGDVAAGTEAASAKRLIRRAIARLEALGAITRLKDAQARRNAIWLILVEQPQLPVETDVDNPVETEESDVETEPMGGHQCPPELDTSVLLSGHQCPPEWTPVSSLKRGTNLGTSRGERSRTKTSESGTSLGDDDLDDDQVEVVAGLARRRATPPLEETSSNDAEFRVVEISRAATRRASLQNDARVLAERGTPLGEIATTLGVSPATITRWLR